ncbi:MAG: hypothetical protein JST23_01550 [Bacteroidetes bacterium]|nr:hypothetical protein [Bacteroidota bacterium]
MGIKLNYKTVALFIFIIGVSATCRKNRDCKREYFAFTTFATAYPDLDSINKFDTLWLQLDQSVIFKDNISGSNIDYSKAANLGCAIGFFNLVAGGISNPDTIPVAAVSLFSIKLIDGLETVSTNPQKFKEYKFSEVNGRYKLKIAIVPHNAGIFSISISNATNVYKYSNPCSKASFEINFEQTNQHIYFYEQNRPGYTPSLYEQTHLYCFKVK